MMNIKLVSINDVYNAMHDNHKRYDKASIKAAYDYMEKKHDGVKRVSGEPYSQHPLRVALRMAEWGHESPCIIAALLHDVVEDTETELDEIRDLFGKQVADMVNAVTKVKKTLDAHEELPKTERLRQSDVKLLHNMDDKSLFIKVSDRIDNLETIDVMPIEKQIAKAVHTRNIIIPALKLEGAFKLVDELESLCFRIEHRAQFDAIEKHIKNTTISNKRSINNTLHLMENTLLGKKKYLPASVVNLRDYIVDFNYSVRSPISIFRQISREATNLDNEFNILLNKKNIALYDLTLIVDEKINDNIAKMSTTDVFFKFYEAIFLDAGIIIENVCNTTYGDSVYLFLSDEMQNKYRLFIKTQSEYMEYCLGDSMKEISEFPWSDVDEYSPETGTYKNKIKVFTRNGEARTIDEDATVLDFAFKIHTEIGYHFDYALINDNKEKAPAHRKLNYGDKIEIRTSPTVDPQLSWFRYVKTSKAIDKLVKYFEFKQLNISANAENHDTDSLIKQQSFLK